MTSRFPNTRLRRLRELPALRRMTAEASLSVGDFVYPMFATHGRGVREPVEPMPGIFRLSPDLLAEEAAEASELGIPSTLLFGLPYHKDAAGSGAYDPEGIVQEAIRAVKGAAPDLAVMTDVCLCEYTDHGHCGVVSGGRVDNDATLELLARTALSHVEAGADVVAPSAMMDGQGGRDTARAGLGGPRRHAHHGVLGQVRIGVLRPLPRGRRLHAGLRRPQGLPDGSRQRKAGPARDGA